MIDEANMELDARESLSSTRTRPSRMESKLELFGFDSLVNILGLNSQELFDVIVGASDISDEQKAQICKKFGVADKCLVDGADEYLQLLDVVSDIIRAFSNMPEEFSYDT